MSGNDSIVMTPTFTVHDKRAVVSYSFCLIKRFSLSIVVGQLKMAEEAPRPVSVRDLRKIFEGKGKPQSPSDFNSAARASAARHNVCA